MLRLPSSLACRLRDSRLVHRQSVLVRILTLLDRVLKLLKHFLLHCLGVLQSVKQLLLLPLELEYVLVDHIDFLLLTPDPNRVIVLSSVDLQTLVPR